MLRDRDRDDVRHRAFKFHRTLADEILEMTEHISKDTGIKRVALSGGVFQNLTLLRLLVSELENVGFEVLLHQKVPPNDGGLSLGMAVIAAARGLNA